jgi:hypothetical protein
VERPVLRVAALVDKILGSLVLGAYLDQLGPLRVLFPKVDAEPALSGLYRNYGSTAAVPPGR